MSKFINEGYHIPDMMFEKYEFPRFFFVGLAAVTAFIFLEIMEGWVIAKVPDFIEMFVTFLIVVSALSLLGYIIAFVLREI